MKYPIKYDYDVVSRRIMDERWTFRAELDTWKYNHIEDKLNESLELQLWFQLNIQFRPELG